MITRTYSELKRIETYEDRYEYLRLKGAVGESTFGAERYLNQGFYRSYEWKRVRDVVIARDFGLDLGIEGFEIHSNIHVHHMNPMTVEAIEQGVSDILDPEYLITVSQRTHNAIHYGDKTLLAQVPVVRRPGDTTPWRK